MPLRRSFALCCVFCAMVFCSVLKAQLDPDTALIRTRLFAEQVDLADNSAAVRALKTQNSDGSWADVQYADQSATQWLPMAHLDRLLSMARVCVAPSTDEKSKQLLGAAVAKGLEFWLARRPVSTNWWQMEIGQPQRLGPLLILMRERLPEALLKSAASVLLDPSQAKSWARTGQNLVWICTGTVYRGCVLDRPEDLATGFSAIAGQVAIQQGEGIQVDFSFHQHGPQLYSGGYGLSFLESLTRWACLAEGSRYGFGEQRKALLANLVLDGARWMVRGGNLDLSVRGREIVRPASAHAAEHLAELARRLATIVPNRTRELEDFCAHVADPDKPLGVEGCRYFWRSDYLVYQSNGYMFSLRMSSSRTTGTEIINNENLLGYWLPFGLTQLMHRGDEYTDIFPVWDWARLPGVTSNNQVPSFHYQTHDSLFVAGASDGRVGVAAMVLNKDELQAKKSWFVFDDRIVALGAGVRSGRGELLSTSLNQCVLRGPVIMDGTAVTDDNRRVSPAHWVHHDGVGYVLNEGPEFLLSCGVQEGSWGRLSKSESSAPVSKQLFRLWCEQPEKSGKTNYAYTLLPRATAKETASYVQKPDIEILSNTEHLQAVRTTDQALAGLVFFEPGTCKVSGALQVSVDKACLVLLRNNDGWWDLTVSAPAGMDRVIQVTLEGIVGRSVIDLELPQGLREGSSLTRTRVLHLAVK